MPWRPLPQIAFAVCTYPFQPSSAADLPLDIGDELYIIEQGGVDGGWYRGYLVAPPSLLAGLTSVKGQTLEARVFSGIFPKTCVEIREILSENRAHTLGDHVGRAASLSSQKSRSIHRTSINGAPTPARAESPPPPLPTGVPVPDNGILAGKAARKSGGEGLEPTSARQKSREVEGLKLSGLPPRKSVASQNADASMSPTTAPLSPRSLASRDPNAPRPPAPVPMLKIGDETPTSAQEPLVDEIASCLREWHSTKVHELLLARQYSSLDKMSSLVTRLDIARRQLLHKVLTAYELRRLRERTVWDLVTGNRMLSGEVIVRSPSQKGRILTCEDSPVELSRLQSEMSLLAERPQPPVDEHIVHHLFMAISNNFGEVKSSTTLAIHLCLKTAGEPIRPVSEVFAMDVSNTQLSSSAMDANLKTLFADLSSTDIGEGAGSGSELYLVLKVLANEQLSETSSRPSMSRDDSSNDGAAAAQSGTLRGGRRSHLWGNKQGAESGIAGVAARERQVDYRPNSVNKPRTPSSQDKKFVKRTIAAGAVRVDELMRKNDETEVTIRFYSPSTNPEERADLDETWDDILHDLLPSTSGIYKPYAFTQPFTLSLKSFTHDDVETLIRKTPTLLLNVNPTRKIGFSGAPTKPRSDIYLTLTDAVVTKNAHLAHPKFGNVSMAQATALSNLQLTLEVRRSSGERIENCIYPSCNSAGHTAWRTTAVQKGEPWNLTIRLAIAPEDVPGCHVVMSIADAPGFPFALCWMPLWLDGAFTRDSAHSLSLYSYDEYTSSMISGRGAYLALPWSVPKQTENGMVLAALHVQTYLCSTKYSQDPTLLGLLKWTDSNSEDLKKLLKRFVFVPEIEIVKLLPDVFDSLFEILTDNVGFGDLEDLVFSALVFVLGIVHDRRFNVGPLFDQYADTRFRHADAASSILRAFHRLLDNPVDPEASRKLRAAFKVGAHVLKFITRARMKQRSRDIGDGSANSNSAFNRDLLKIFKSLESLMTNPAPILIGTKTLLVQNFHTWMPELMAIMSTGEIMQIATNFVNSCADVRGKLILYKLVLIIHLSESEICKFPDNRRTLVVNTVRWLTPYWGKTDAVTEQWKDQVRLCCSVVASQVNNLGGQEACDYIPKLVDSYRAIQATPRPAKKSLSLLFPQQYPFPSRPIIAETTFDEALVEISAVLAATTGLPTLINLDLEDAELAEFLFSALQVYISVLDGDAFPKSWLSLHIYHHRSAMRTLEKLSSNLIDQFLPHPDDADQFNTELWRAFFDALLKLVGSDALALETFPEQKRRAVWKIAGDVREQGADLLRRSWDAIGWETSAEDRRQYGLEKLGGYQVQYVPGLVAPIVELCLSVHEGLRSVATSVLQTMIVSEWTLSQDLSLIQAEMIDCLDNLFKTKNPTESIVQKLFISELLNRFEPLAKSEDDPIFVSVRTLVATIDELLDLLAAVHGAESIGEAFRIMDTLHLMEFLKDMHREDIYIRYVHQLADIQSEAKNCTEAGLALRMHADLYEWDPNGLLEPLEDPEFPTQTSFERKEKLYFQMIKHFEDGQSWDNALGCYIELSTQYEQNIFDFAKLARTQRAMATIYESIGKGEQSNPRYFRVIYKGLGFPTTLRDKQFIFQGSTTDRLETFKDRLQQQHPSAQIMGPNAEEDLEGQYLQVFPVSPQKDLLHPVYQRAKVAQSVRDYHLLARPSVFTTHSRRQGSEGGVKEQTVEKTVYNTAESFPTILRRSEVVEVGTITLTAVQAALERTTRKTSELASLEKRVIEGDDGAFTPLTEALMFAVDPASESSVSHYRELLPKREEDSDEDSDEDTDKEEPPLDPLENALRVALIDHALVLKRCLGHYSRAHQKATQADLMSRKLLPSHPLHPEMITWILMTTVGFESTFAPELEVLAPMTASSPEPTTSWIVNNSLPVTAPNGAANQTSASPSGDSARIASPPPDQIQRSGSKAEKNRISLAFLKRTSFFGGKQPASDYGTDTAAGSQRPDSPEKERPAVPPKDHSQDNAGGTFLDDSDGDSHNGDAGDNGRKLSFSAERDRNTEAQYYASDSASRTTEGGGPPYRQLASASDNNRFGSVKKRLSNLNIGRKWSKAGPRDPHPPGRVHPLLEE